MNEANNSTQFPRDLVEWSGHHSGGVKRLFDPESGRPGKVLLRTHLISKLESWAASIAAGTDGTPRILLLVGGPGNGKTEAIEHTIKCVDEALSATGQLILRLSEAFHPTEGKVPRIVQVDAGSLAIPIRPLQLNVVQDASVTAGQEGTPASAQLIDELRLLAAGPPAQVYLCCVNRGVLDDALIHAIDNGLTEEHRMLETITRSVSLSSTAPRCWPLEGFPAVAVWPMDAESLMLPPDGSSSSPAASLLTYATDPSLWPALGTCPAGDKCPFCNGQRLLQREEHRESLLRILRWFELASGKRWSFRDLFSLLSYLLAGHQHAVRGQKADPCAWAAHLSELDAASQKKRGSGRNELTAIFRLATSSYQHALFHCWDAGVAATLRRDMRDLGLSGDDQETRTLKGLQAFLHDRKASYLPTTISSLLMDLARLLDPALALPELEVPVSGRTRIRLAEIDIRFSRSIRTGIEFIRKYQALSPVEMEILRRLAGADSALSSPAIRRKKPTAANRIQCILRDFACRLVRRSICTRSASVADAETLRSFQEVVEDERGKHLHDVANKVRQLLNNHNGFEVSLTTTFGQPLPPPQRQATLIVPPQLVKPVQLSSEGRPRSPICFLQVGQSRTAPPVALTYDLFKAVKELERGLSAASLPRTVVALLDTTRAKLAGHIVRDSEILAGARIEVGDDGTKISMSWNGFVSDKGGRAA
jgi:hypothetical protein